MLAAVPTLEEILGQKSKTREEDRSREKHSAPGDEHRSESHREPASVEAAVQGAVDLLHEERSMLIGEILARTQDSLEGATEAEYLYVETLVIANVKQYAISIGYNIWQSEEELLECCLNDFVVE